MMLGVLFISFLVLMFFGMPIAFSMGFSAFLAILSSGKDIFLIIPAKLFSGVDSFALMAIPFFILAGNLMEGGGVSSRLIKFANSLVGFMKGGLAYVAVVAECVFSGVSGSAAADTSAIGALLIPSMVKKGYHPGWVSCLIGSAGTIGPLIPPSLLVIIYSSMTGLSVAALFIAGIVPGLLVAAALMILSWLYVKKHPNVATTDVKFSFKAIVDAFLDAWLALLLPVIIVGGILFGIFTATEAAAISVVIALFIGLFVYKELALGDIWRILAESAKSSAVLMMVVGMAATFAWVLGVQKFPNLAVEFLMNLSSNPDVIILLVIILLLIVGCFVETVAALVILIPVLHPIALQYGFQPIHWATFVIYTTLIGSITPPVGMLLFIAAGIAKVKMKEVLRYVTPFIIALIVVGFLIAYVPWFTMVLPKFFNL